MVLNNPVSFQFPCVGLTDYPFNSQYMEPEDLKVIYRNASAVDTVLVFGTDYFVTGDLLAATISTNSIYTEGILIIFRETPGIRPADYKPYNAAPMDQIDADLDRLTMIAQEQDRKLKILQELLGCKYY